MVQTARKRKKSEAGENLNPEIVESKNKGRKKQKAAKGWSDVAKIGMFCAIFGAAIISVSIYKVWFSGFNELSHEEIFSKGRTDFSKDRRSVSQILKEIVDNAKILIDYYEEMSLFASGKHLDEYLKAALQPIRDRVASIQTQTTGYEKMEHIPGGPLSFIESSNTELTALEAKFMEIYTEATRVINQERKKINEAGRVINDIRLKTHYIYEVVTHPKLVEAEIYLLPLPPATPKESDKVVERAGKEKIVEAVNELANLYQSWEESAMMYKKVLDDAGIAYDEAEKLDEYTQHPILNEFGRIKGEIEDFKRNNGHLLMATLNMHGTLAKRIHDSEQNLITYVVDKRRSFLDLQDDMQLELLHLRKKINQLRK